MVFHATSLHHARCRDDDARLLAGVQFLRLVDVAHKGEAVEAEGIGVVFDHVVDIVIEEVDIHAEDFGGIDSQWAIHKYWDFLGQLALVIEVVEQVHDLLGAADGERRYDEFAAFLDASVVYDFQ